MKRNLVITGLVALSMLATAPMEGEAKDIQSWQVPAQQKQTTGMYNNTTGISNNKLNKHGTPPLRPHASRHQSKNFVPQRQNFKAKMLERFDTDHDGKINNSEHAQMRKVRQQHRKLQSATK